MKKDNDSKYAKMMTNIADLSEGDAGSVHRQADELLIKILATEGFRKTVDAWHGVKKWYA